MAIDLGFYIVTRDIALRTGDIQNLYKTDDDRYVIDSRQLSRIRLTSQEYMTGLEGIEMISREEALTYIARGGYNTDAIEAEEEEKIASEAIEAEEGNDTTTVEEPVEEPTQEESEVDEQDTENEESESEVEEPEKEEEE